jgi:hypothetical protein
MTFAPRPPKGGAQALRQTYVPTGMQQAMSQHMQNTAPAHLKKYVGNGAYVPQHAQKALAAHMDKTMPGHMKQYAGAYLQQKVDSGTIRQHVVPTGPSVGPAPLPDKLNLSHSGAVTASQYEAKFYNNLFASDQQGQRAPGQQPGQQFQPGPQPGQQSYPPQLQQSPQQDPYGQQPPQQPMHPQAYEFIMQPGQPKRRGGFSFGGSSLPIKILAVLAGILVVVLVANAFRGVLGGGSANTAELISVAQDQQSIIHLTAQITEQNQLRNISVSAQNFTMTANLGLTSQQADLLTYMQQNHKKVKAKVLALKVDPALDTQLQTAASSGDLDAAYKEIMTAQLNGYKTALQQAYAKTPGPNGRKLLSQEFESANLLLTQLNSN